MFVDDLKQFGTINNIISISPELQRDLDRLMELSKLWSTELNIFKCKALYFGKLRLHDGYRLSSGNGVHTLVESNEEKDLGVIVSRDLKWSKQCAVSAAKAKRVLSHIKSSFSYHGKDTILPLYTA